MFFDAHNHSQYSFDGEKTSVEKSSASAIEKGLGGICFTDHCDFDPPAVKENFGALRNEVFDVVPQQKEIDRVNELIAKGEFVKNCPKKFKIFKGAEVGMQEKSRDSIREFLSINKFDQVTASVHYLEDEDPYYGQYYNGKTWEEAFGGYLEVILKEIKWLNDFDVLGHFDYVARYAPYTKESILYKDFPDLFDEILAYLAQNGKALEINTKTYKTYGLRNPQLDRDILIRFLELGGEYICLSSDSHAADQVGFKFDYYAQYIKSVGFRKLTHFEDRKPVMVTI